MENPIFNGLRSWGLLIVALQQIVGTIFAGIVAFAKLVLNSKLPSAEVHKTHSEAGLNEAESQLRIAKARSIEFQDELSIIEVVQKLTKDGLTLELLLTQKNDMIADLENTIFQQDVTIKNQAADIAAYERLKLGALGIKRLEQAADKTGTGE